MVSCNRGQFSGSGSKARMLREPVALQRDEAADGIAIEGAAVHQDFIRQQAEEIRKIVLLRAGFGQHAIVIEMQAEENLRDVFATRCASREQIERAFGLRPP